MQKKIFVIIVTWNGMKWIKRCLDALRGSTYPVQTIVIDNGSKDETVSFIQKNYPEIHIIESGKNLGFGQANNVGMRYALANGCDYVYLLNQDAYVYPDMFQILIDEAEKKENQERYAIYSPLHINSNVHKMDKQFKDYLQNIASTIAEDVYLSEPKAIYPVNGVPAAGWLLPRNTLETIGGFDPMFFHYGEDVNYFQRVNYHKYTTGIVPNAKMIHDRDSFGNPDAYMVGKIARGIDSYIMLDINKSKSQIIKMLFKEFVLFLFMLCKGKPKYTLEFAGYFPNFIGNFARYKISRFENKKKQSNWL